jgi:predicted nuclease of restriction endonuclease-like (RecB) superfamily
MVKNNKKISANKEVIQSIPEGYHSVLTNTIDRIKAAQTRAMVFVNRELVTVYLDIGKTINEQQQHAEWGASIVEQFAKDLQNSFPGMKGFSPRNLWNMRDLYLAYSQNLKLQTLSAEISWSHNIAILEKCKGILEREFYMRMSKKYSWSYRVLLNQISSKAYERTITSQTNFEKSLPEKIQPEAKMAVKDEYAFGFLDAGEEYDERKLEKALLSRIEDFLREVGGAYTFMGSQYRLEVGDQEFFIDILLYHRKLKSLVAIELKIGPFIPEYVGKMQFYLSVLDDTVRLKDENPSIGIIMCKEKNRTIVEYTLKEANKPINVATYQMFSELPKELRKELPSPEQIAKLLEFIE